MKLTPQVPLTLVKTFVSCMSEEKGKAIIHHLLLPELPHCMPDPNTAPLNVS